jgi:hypothetical protein
MAETSNYFAAPAADSQPSGGATRKAREYAEVALDARQKKLESGKSTSFVVLLLQRDLTGAQSDEIAALVQYKRSLSRPPRTKSPRWNSVASI